MACSSVDPKSSVINLAVNRETEAAAMATESSTRDAPRRNRRFMTWSPRLEEVRFDPSYRTYHIKSDSQSVLVPGFAQPSAGCAAVADLPIRR